jgi:hypothetical protein
VLEAIVFHKNLSASKECVALGSNRERIPNKVEDPTNVDLEGVPPRIGILLVQHLDEINKE